MQNIEDGNLYSLDSELMKKSIQAAADKAIPNRANQGAIFSEGEIVEIKGGRFVIKSILTRGRLVLKGLPAL